MLRRTVLAVFLAAASVLFAAPKRRAVLTAPNPPVSTPAGWLYAHAHRLQATELPAPDADLAPFGALVGDADVVGLGDGTHGTREFYTLKLRLIDYLVREEGFDLIAFEAPLPLFDRLDEYVQTGSGDPRAILGEGAERLGYNFWNAEEIVAVVEWLRQYNAHRGGAPAVHIAGADVFDAKGGAERVIAYLRGLDPAAATSAEQKYDCILKLQGLVISGCTSAGPNEVRSELEARRAELTARSSVASYETALRYALIVLQNFTTQNRDTNMTANVTWLREHRSTTRRIVYWAHNEHVGKILSKEIAGTPAGMGLKASLGAEYVAIGMLARGGEYITWTKGTPLTVAIPEMPEDTYEWTLRFAAPPAVFIPLRGELPPWLAGPARHFLAGSAPGPTNYVTVPLAEKFDGVIFVHATSPIHPLAH